MKLYLETEKLNVVKNNQLLIVKSYFIFFDVLEIFLEAVFLFNIPDLATCIRID